LREDRLVKIAQVAPLCESVPPKLYGGTERVVSYLTDELVRQGHQVTLFASGDSETKARLYPVTERGLRLDPACRDPLAHHVILLDQVAAMADDFDIVHFHTDYLQFPLVRRLALRAVTTLHGRLDIPDLVPLFARFRDVPLVSISDAQRKPLWWANWVSTIYHGLPPDAFTLCAKPGSYLAFLGRMSPEKGPDRAIRIARRAGIPLRMAAKVDPADQAYFDTCIRPLLAEPGVEYLGEIDEHDKQRFLGDALALLFPIDWPEPFGIVLTEAMACGTPVIASHAGSLAEVVADAGLVVEPHDSAAIAASIRRLMEDAVFRDALIESGYKQAARFTWAASGRQVREFLQRALGDSSIGLPSTAG